MHPGEPILIICHDFPPIFDIGGRRWAKFAKELAGRGHPVHVIRSAHPPGAAISLWDGDIKSPNIIAYPLPDRYPIALTRWPVTGLWHKLSYRFWKLVLPLCTKGNWYDRGLFWRKPMLKLAGKLINEHGIRNVIVTGAPFSLMAFATELKEPFPELHMIADFRDPWTWGTDYGFGTLTPERTRIEKEREALVARTYDKLIASTSAITEHLRTTYGGSPEHYATIPHAMDPDDMHTGSSKRKDGTYKMIYAGNFYGGPEAETYFTFLLESFEALREKQPALLAGCRFDLYITGHGTATYSERVKKRGLENHIHFHRPLPPQKIMERIAGSDLVIAFLPGNKKDIMVTKFNEIFHLRKPLLHIGEPGLVSRTIIDRRLGDSLRVEELVTELPRIISGERPIVIDMNADHSAFLLGPLTDRLMNEVLA